MSELKVFFIPIKKNMIGITTVKQSFYLKTEADKVIAHQKYKRCLAMAKLCHWKSAIFIYKKEKNDFYWRWYDRWKALAEKFKEAK